MADDDSGADRTPPFSDDFKRFIPQDWAPYPPPPDPLPASGWAEIRRDRLRQLFPGERLVLPAGPYKTRSNDCDYRFRPHSAFAYFSGLGQDYEPDAVLVIDPDNASLYFHPRVPRADPEFYSSARYGEMWVGQRLSQDEMAAWTRLTVKPIEQLAADLARPGPATRVLREADPAITTLVDVLRGRDSAAADAALATASAELRLVKDQFEIEQLELACAATKAGFDAVIADLPEAVRRGRGERWVEGVFGLHARHLGNAVGYDTIAASGDRANTLHWIRNDGDLKPGDLLLLDAGVEVDSLYTADITRTLPVTGGFSDVQREVYQAVLEAQQAGIAAARPGAQHQDIHAAAIRVIAQRLSDWGCLPVSVDQALSKEGGQHRRWMVHGTSHHLGLDVHDCAQARAEHYRLGRLRPGMVVTVEPGLYFKSTDLLAPAPFRGVGVRIEDDILITDDGCRNLSAAFPKQPDQVETWLATVQSR
ncbi:MAG: aminopeptidase P family protein [Propionibacteriaceae bacterium]|jgi:Xaa-Pro aminopeptidase|nr:aminopeptidase P family protein [Propionibacteriaceae bacterium]